ncbi:MAG: hypothetical protein ACTSU2_16575 [Promethearchaeota archaeon]
MPEDEENDVLKKLREVRRKLQESLSEDTAGKEKDEVSKKILIEGQADLEKKDKAAMLEKKEKELDKKTAKKKPKLYKAGESPKALKGPKKYKSAAPTKVGLSAKKMAGIQKRIRQKVAARQSMSNKRRALLIIALFIASAPLFLVTSLAMVSCEFDISKIGIGYTETASESDYSRVNLFLPIHNPSILPATIGQVELELWDSSGNIMIGKAHSNSFKTISPKHTINFALDLDLDKEKGGQWLANLFNTLELNLTIKNLKYNGMSVPGEFQIPSSLLDIKSLLKDALSGFALDELILDALPSSSHAGANGFYSGIYNLYDPKTGAPNYWELFKMHNHLGRYAPKESQFGDISLDMNLDITETNKEFSVRVTNAVFGLSPIEGFDLGNIRIFGLNAGLYVDTNPNPPDYNDPDFDPQAESVVERYQYPLVKLNTLPSNNTYMGKQNGDINLNFNGDSEINVELNITKDNIGTATIHPSADPNIVNWSDPVSASNFVEQARLNYPLFYFLYNLIENGSLNTLIAINDMTIEVFGITVPHISVPRELLGAIIIQNQLDINSLLNSLTATGVGIFTGFSVLLDGVVTGGAGLQKYYHPFTSSNPDPSRPVDMNALEDMIDMDFDFDMNLFHESWGDDANLSLSLPINIVNFPIDLSLGLKGAELSLASELTDGSKESFAFVSLTSNDSDVIYIPGYGSNVTINIDLVLFKNPKKAPYVAQFLRTLLEEFRIDAYVGLKVDAILLFRQNYTIPNLDLSLPLDLDLGDTVASMVGDLFSGMLSPDSIQGLMNGSGFLSDPKESLNLTGNPITMPYELALDMLFKNPLMGFILSDKGENWVEHGAEELSALQLPISSQDFVIEVNRLPDRTSLDIIVQDVDLTGLLPITVGVGPADLIIWGHNQYGEWEQLFGLKINNYFELKPEGEETADLSISLQVYDSEALCTFIHRFIDEGKMSIKLDGYMTLNLSGVYMDDLHLVLPMEDIDTGFNFSSTLSMVVDSLDSAEYIGNAPAPKQASWWDGNINEIPFVSQLGDLSGGLGLDGIIDIGDFKIYALNETGWPDPHKGNVTIQIGLPITNHLMDLSITQMEMEVWYNINDSNSKLMRVVADPINLYSGIQSELKLNIYILKSNYTEAWVNNILKTFGLSGYVTANLSLHVFNCDIGPISLEGDNALDLYKLVPSVADLLKASIPITEKARTNGPYASQDIMDTIGKFALMYITMPKGSYDPKCGPQNWTTPMMDVRAGIALMPNINMTIEGGSFQLLDANIYNAIYDPNENNTQEASHYSLMADVSFVPNKVYFNNTYSSPYLPGNYSIDPLKPYYDNTTDTLYQSFNPNDSRFIDGTFKPYNLSTYGQFELSLKIFNLSYGTYDTRYPKHLWRRLGGPYFPVQTFGPEYGGYPYYRREYHPYFSPAYNILSTLLSDFDMNNMDIGGILENIKLNGTMTVNIFSMNITLDVGTDVVSSLMSSLVGGLSLGMKEFIRESTTPLPQYSTPIAAFENKKTGGLNKMTHRPFFPNAAAGTAFDIASFLVDYPLVGVWERNNHEFCPQHGWGGTNVDPRSEGYHGGIYDPVKNPLSSNYETFVKDVGYERFKLITENYRKSMHYANNPYFETVDENGNPIEDPTQWPLKWRGLMGRTRTMVLYYAQALLPRIPLGILSGMIDMWIEDSSQPCTTGPFGYAFINESVFIQNVNENITPDDHWDGWKDDFWIDANGKPNPHGYVIGLNIRGFEGPLFSEFLGGLMRGFKIRFIANGIVNVSIFGYDLYGIKFGNMGMGEAEDAAYYQRCIDYQKQFGGGGTVWGPPTVNGTVNPEPPPEERDFPPEEFIPEYAEVTMSFPDFEEVLDGLTSDIFNILLDGHIEEISTTGFRFTTNEVDLDQLMALPAWLINIEITLKSNVEDLPDPDQVQHWYFVGYVVSDQMLELTDYPGSSTDPYNFYVNELQYISLTGTWHIKPISLYIRWDMFGGINIGTFLADLIQGMSWQDALRDALGKDNVYLKMDPMIVNVGFPYEFEYMFQLELDVGIIDILDALG